MAGKIPVLSTLMILMVGSWPALTSASDTSLDNTGANVLHETAKELADIRDIAAVPMFERERILITIADQFPVAQQIRVSQAEQYVRNLITIVDWLTSCDFGDREVQNILSQQMVLHGLSYAEALPTDLEFRLVSQIRLGSTARNIGAEGQKVTGSEWQLLRIQLLEYRLRLWRRLDRIIDPTWDPDDVAMLNLSVPGGAYRSGVAPEAIREPEIRRQYEAALDANRQKAARYREQHSARQLRDRYLPRVKNAVADMYAMKPITAEDMELLEAYLRIYVSDQALRTELFDLAQAAASK